MDLVEFARLNDAGMIVENPDKLYPNDRVGARVGHLRQPRSSILPSTDYITSVRNSLPRLVITKSYLSNRADELLEKPYS